MIEHPLPPAPPYCSEVGRATREALWRKRLDIEREWNLHEGDELAFKTLHMRVASWLATLGLKSIGLYDRGLRNATTPALRRVEWRPPRLPRALDGMTILHLSDFHFSRIYRGFTEGDAACVDGVSADFLLMTGDYRYGHFGPVEHVPHHLREVLQGVTIREGLFATLGNHDISLSAEGLRELDIDVLMNEGRSVRFRGENIWFGGTDDAHFFRCASLDAALDGRANGAEAPFTILLTHTPELYHEASLRGVDLYLCGHTHGGQVCLPRGIPLKMNARAPFRYARGEWTIGNMLGLTTNGLGTTDLPLRYNAPPEAHLITLRSAPAPGTD